MTTATVPQPAGGTATIDGATRSYAEAHRAFAEGAGAQAPAAVQSMRAAALDRFQALGFPTTKNEDWHFTSVSSLLEHEFTHLTAESGDVTPEHVAPFLFSGGRWPTVVFVNGRYAAHLSSLDGLAEGVRVLDLATAWREAPELVDQLGQITSYDDRTFTALNTAFMIDGLVVDVDADVTAELPIHVVYVMDATAAKGMVHPRNLVRVGRNAKATVIESYVSPSDAHYFVNAVTEVALRDGATLHHVKIQREGMRAFHVGTIEASQARDSHYHQFSFASGGRLSRTNVYTTLDGEGCGATLNGLYMLADEQHCDHQTMVVHAQPNTYSRELYKGILDDRSHGVFNGKVYVHPVAQKTDGKQTNNALLLSESAEIDTKPQLEIFADDVKCTHGATVGRLDEQALFYMKSRGIDAVTARELLIYAFAADAIETIECDPVKVELERVTLKRYTHVEG